MRVANPSTGEYVESYEEHTKHDVEIAESFGIEGYHRNHEKSFDRPCRRPSRGGLSLVEVPIE